MNMYRVEENRKGRPGVLRYALTLLLCCALLCGTAISVRAADDSVLPIGGGEAADSTASTGGSEAADSTAPTGGGEAADSTLPAEGGEAADSTAPAEGGEAADSTAPTEGGEAADSTLPAEGGEAADSTAPAEGSEAADSTAPAEGGEAAEAAAPLAAAAPAAAGAESGAEVTGQDDEVEIYDLPAGSAYILEIGEDFVFTNTAEGNAVQNAMKDALTYIRSLYEDGETHPDRTATIVVQDGTYEGGLNLDSEQNNVLTDLIMEILGLQQNSANSSIPLNLRIVAHDAFTMSDSGEISFHADSAGNVNLEGDINVQLQNLNLSLAGIYLSTRGLIKVKNADSVTYYGTVRDDSVELEVSRVGGAVRVDTGAGNDSVKAAVSKRPNVSVSMTVDESIVSSFQELLTLDTAVIPDALKDLALELTRAIDKGVFDALSDPHIMEVAVELGAGNDVSDIKLIDSTDILFNRGQVTRPDGTTGFSYGFGFQVDMTAADVDISGGEGDDRISIAGGREFTLGQNLIKAVNDYIADLDLEDLPATTVDVYGGGGDDLFTVHTTSAFTTYGGVTVATVGNDGYDRLHLVGKLNGDVDADRRIVAVENSGSTELTIEALAQLTILGELTDNALHLDLKNRLHLLFSGVDALTDALENKRSISLSDVRPGDMALPFTDYVVQAEGAREDAPGTVDLDLAATGLVMPAAALMLTNVKVDQERMLVKKLLAEGMNILLTGEQITIDGEVSGRNVIVSVLGRDEILAGIDTQIMEDDLSDPVGFDFEFGIYEVTREVFVKLTSRGGIKAAEAVELSSQLILDKSLTPGADYIDKLTSKQFNPFTLKFGTSEVVISGSITAGGNILARSQVDVDVAASNDLLKLVIPLAVSASFGHSKVRVDENAVLISGAVEKELPDLSAPAGQEGDPLPTVTVIVAETPAGIVLDARSFNRLYNYAGGGALPVSLALGTVEYETSAVAEGKARLSAGSGVVLLANSYIEVVSSASGRPANVWDVASKDGIFVAGSFVFGDAVARIGGEAEVEARAGDVRLEAASQIHGSTVTVAIPTQDATVSEQFTVFRGIKFVEKLLGFAPAANQSFGGKLVSKITSSNILGNLFTDSTASAGAAEVDKLQLMGALSVSYLEGTTDALIETEKSVTASGEVKLLAHGETDSYVRADGSLYKTPNLLPGMSWEEVPQNAVGAGIAVSLLYHDNHAEIRSGSISANGVQLKADLGLTGSRMIVKAGHMPEHVRNKLGLTGAIAIHIISIDESARIAKNAALTLGRGDLSVRALGQGEFTTVGDASGRRARLGFNIGPLNIPLQPTLSTTKGNVGIGAGVAVELLSAKIHAEIEDGVTITQNEGSKINSAEVLASYKAIGYMEAAAGAEGGKAAVPVLALSLGSADVSAKLGRGSALDVAGDVTVSAANSVERRIVSDAKAVGAGVGVGASFAIAVIDDKSYACLGRAVDAGNVRLEASSISRLNENVKASARGAAANTSPTFGVTGAGFQHLFKPGTADNFLLTNTSLLGGLTGYLKNGGITADRVSALTANRPSPQTPEGNIQISASLALNVQFNEARAELMNQVKAAGDLAVLSTIDTDAILYGDSSAVNSTTGVGVGVAINYIEATNVAKVGPYRLEAGGDITVKADIVEAEAKRSVEAILADLLQFLADTQGSQLLMNALLKAENVSSLEELLEKDPSYKALTDSKDKETVRRELMEALIAQLKDDSFDTSSALLGELLDATLDQFLDTLMDPEFLLSFLTGDASAAFERFFAQQSLTARLEFNRIRDAVVTALTNKFGNPSELDGVGSRISTSTVSGAGASNVGVAGSAAISWIRMNSEAAIASGTEQILAGGTVTIDSRSAQKIYTTASASTDSQGLPGKNMDGSGAVAEGKSVGVGASFAVSTIKAESAATLGEDRVLEAAALHLESEVQNDIDTISVAGQDPIGRSQQVAPKDTPGLGEAVINANDTTAKDIAVDASVALNMIDNILKAAVGAGTRLTLTAGDVLETRIPAGEDAFELANLYIRAWQRGQTYTSASGFASGSTAAVGAGVAANLANSDVQALLEGQGSVEGRVIVEAITSNEDEAHGFAMVSGSCLDRYLDHVQTLLDYANFTDYDPTGAINAFVVNKLNGFVNPYLSKLGGLSSQRLPLLWTLLQRVPITLPAAFTGGASVAGALADTGAAQREEGEGKSLNIAAAAAVNITEHMTLARIDGDFSASDVQLNAENRANFRTNGSGITASLPTELANQISGGLAVSVNGNTAYAELGGKITARDKGGVKVHSTLTQNMDRMYPGLLAAQAIAGSLGGTSAAVGIAGAVSVVVAHARAAARILDGTILRGGAVDLLSYEKSKLSLRAGSLQAGGQTVGVGASFALLYAENELDVSIGSGADIEAASLSAKAQRAKVTADDYVFPLTIKNLFTVNVPDDDAANKGLINLNIKESNSTDTSAGANSLEINLGMDKVMDLLDALNYFSAVNYYVESIAGAIAAGADSKAAVSGAAAMLFANAATTAEVGENTSIRLTGDFTLDARTDTISRMIGGSLGASTQHGVGINAAGMDDRDKIYALLGANTTVTGRDLRVSAGAENDTLVATVAAAASANGVGVGGGAGAIITGNDVKASVGKGSVLDASGRMDVLADNFAKLMLLSASVSGSGGQAAAGGTFAVIVSENKTNAALEEGVLAKALKGARISAQSGEDYFNLLASLSGTTGQAGVAGTVGVQVAKSETTASVGAGSEINAAEGSVEILANGDVRQITALVGATAASGAAIGATITVSIFEHAVRAQAGDRTRLLAGADSPAAGRNVLIRATGRDETILVAFAGGAASNLALTGTVTTVVGKTNASASVGDKAYLEAGDSVVVCSDLDTGLYVPAGAVSASGSASIGATVSTLVLENIVSSTLGDEVTAIAYAGSGAANAGVKLPNRDERRKGVLVNANSLSELLMVSVSGGVGGSAGVVGVVNTLVLKNKVNASVGNNARVLAGYDREGVTKTVAGAEFSVEADDDSHLYNLAGGISVGGTAGVGVTVVSMIYDKTVTAILGMGGSVLTSGDVTVRARSGDDVYLLALNLAGGGTAAVGVGANVQIFQSKVHAFAGGDIRADGSVSVRALSDAVLVNIAAAVAGSGTAAVTPVGVVTYFQGETIAKFLEDADVKAAGAVTLSADSTEFITADALGAAGSGAASVSGTVTVIVSKAKTHALALRGASVAADSLRVAALDDYRLVSASAAIAVSGVAGVAVNAVVSVLKNTVTAGIGHVEGDSPAAQAGRITTATGNVDVIAESKRDLVSVAATVGGGQVGVGATVMVMVAGGQLPQDAADSLAVRGEDDPAPSGDDAEYGFDPNSFLNQAFGASHSSAAGYKDSVSDLGAQLAGDGERQSDVSVGHKDTVTDGDEPEEGGTFDGSSGYLDDDFNNASFTDDNDSGERGENAEIDPGKNEDISQAGEVGPRYPTVTDSDGVVTPLEPQDRVMAFIAEDVVVEAAGAVHVKADSLTNVDMLTGTISAGAYAAVSAGVAVAVLFTNVEARIADDACISADGGITVEAISRSAEIPQGDDGAEQARNKALGDALEEVFTTRTIRVVSITGSAALVGVGVSVATVVLQNVTNAVMEGDVEGAASLTVKTQNNYPLTLAATLAASGGAAAVNASVAVVANTGKVSTRIDGDAIIRNTPKVEVLSNLTLDASTFAATLGAGGVAVNAAVSLAINRLDARSGIGGDVSIDSALQELQVASDSHTTANALLLGVAVGGTVGVNTGAAVAIVEPTVHTIVGCTDQAGIGRGSIEAPEAEISVSGTVSSSANSTVLSIAAGAAGVGGNILLVFNDTDARTGIVRKNITANKIVVDGIMKAEAKSALAAGTFGGTAVGISVSYVGLNARNEALLDVSGVSVSAQEIEVYAGRQDDQNTAVAKAVAMAGSAGVVAVGVNAAIADNTAVNNARILGNAASRLSAEKSLELLAYGKASTLSEIDGVNIGGISVAASVAVSVLRSSQTAEILGGQLSVGDLTVGSHLNRSFDAEGKDVTTEEEKDTSLARLRTGTGGLFAAAANVAVAYGRSASLAVAEPGALTVSGDVSIGSYGNAGTKADITNIASPVSAVTAAAMIGASYAQSSFISRLTVPGNGVSDALSGMGDVKVDTDYLARAVANVVPSAGGVEASKLSVKVNAAIAVARSTADAVLNGSGSFSAGSIQVTANGESYADAVIGTPVFSAEISKISVAANVVVAKLKSLQHAELAGVKATLTGDSALGKDGVKVDSRLNDGRSVSANALLGSMDSKGKVELSMVAVKANTAIAIADGRSSAKLTSASILEADKILVNSQGITVAYASTNAPDGAGSIAGIGVNVLEAEANGGFDAVVDTTGAEISAVSMDITTDYTAAATAAGAVSASGVGVSLSGLSVEGNTATASTGMSGETGLKGSGKVVLSGALKAASTGIADAEAFFPGATLTLSGIKLAVNMVDAIVGGSQLTFVEGADITASGVEVTADFNKTGSEEIDISGVTIVLPVVHGAFASLGAVNGKNAELSLVNIKVNKLNAALTAVVTAGFAPAGGAISGDVTVKTTAEARADAEVDEASFSLAVANAVVTEVTATAGGVFSAWLSTDGMISADAVEVSNEYQSWAWAVGGAPNASIALANVKVNGAVAAASTVAEAYIAGAGTLNAGKTSVKVDGIVNANAKVAGTKITVSALEVGVNEARAIAAVTQSAYAKDLSVTGGELSIISLFNAPILDDKGKVTGTYTAAEASVGSNGGKDISLVGGKTSTAEASVTAVINAYMEGVSTALSGALTVRATGDSRAEGKVLSGSSVSLVNVSLMDVLADAAGSFASYIDTTGADISAGSVSVETIYTADSQATVSAAGGVKFSLASVDVNRAGTHVAVTASALVKGSGHIETGSLSVYAEGTLDSLAKAKTAEVTVSGLDVAYNLAVAYADAVQSAAIDASGTFICTGKAEVVSKIAHSLAEAIVGSIGGDDDDDFKLTLVGAGSHEALSYSQISNTAFISGGGTLEAGSVDVHALSEEKTVSSAKAFAAWELSLATLGNLKATAYTSESITAHISNMKVTATNGDVSIKAKGDTRAQAYGDAPGSLSVVDGSKSEIQSYVGRASAPQQVIASLGEDAQIIASGDLCIDSENRGDAESVLNKGTSYNLGEIEKSKIPTNGYYVTGIEVGPNAEVQAENIWIDSVDFTKARSQISSKNVSLALSVVEMYGTNTVQTTNEVLIAEASRLAAAGELEIIAESEADMLASTKADSKGGFVGKGELKAVNTLTRTVKTTVSSDASLEADFGDLTVEAIAGQDDEIETIARVDVGAFVAVGEARAKAYVTNNSSVDIHKGARLKNTFGHLTINAINGMWDMYAYGRVYNSGVGNNPDAKALQELKLNTNVNIGVNGTADSLALIEGRYVDIRAKIHYLYVMSDSTAEGEGLGVNIDSESKVTGIFNTSLSVDAARIVGHDALDIAADASTQRWDPNLDAVAYSIARGIGDATARANISGSSTVLTNVEADAELVGAKVTINSIKYNGDNSRWPHTKRSGIASSDDSYEGSFTNSQAVKVDKSADFILGDAAGGIIIDVSDRAGIRAVGLPEDPNRLIRIANGTIYIDLLSNNLPGSLKVGGSGQSVSFNGNTIYTQRFIGDVEITNRTDMAMELAGVTPENMHYSNPGISIHGSGHKYSFKPLSVPPSITVTNRKSGDVTVTGLIAGHGSTVSFLWTGETGGRLHSLELPLAGTDLYRDGQPTNEIVYGATIFAKDLIVENAAAIGISADERFHAFIFDGGTMDVQCSGESYTDFTPVELYLVDTLPTEDAHEDETITLHVGTVISESVNDMLVSQGLRIYRLKNSNVISVPIPGSVKLITDTVMLSQDAVLDSEAMEDYLYATDTRANTRTYLLPNGTQIIVDATTGTVQAVIETLSNGEEIYVSLTDYEFAGQVIKLANGVQLDLSSGKLTIQPGFTYEALLSGLSGQWLLTQINSGAFKFYYQDDAALGSAGEGEGIYTGVVGGLTHWKSDGQKDYYWLKGYEPQNVDFSAGQSLYYLLLDKSSDSLSVYAVDYGKSPVSVTLPVSPQLKLTLYTGFTDFPELALANVVGTLALVNYDADGNLELLDLSQLANKLGTKGSKTTWHFPAVIGADNHEMLLQFDSQTGDISWFDSSVNGTPVSLSVAQGMQNDANGEPVLQDHYAISLARESAGTAATIRFTAGTTGWEGDAADDPLGKLTVTLRQMTIPGESSKGYRIDENTYIQTNGTIWIIDGSYKAGFTADRFDSSGLQLRMQDGQLTQTTIRKGQQVQLRQITENLAQDTAGTYYYQLGDGKWEKATVTTTGGVSSYSGKGTLLMKSYSSDGVDYFEIHYGLPSVTILGSDGSIRIEGSDSNTQRVCCGKATAVQLGLLKGKELKLVLEPEGALLRSSDTDAADIITDKAEIVSDKGQIGGEGEPITVAPYTEGVTPTITFSTPTSKDTLTSDTFVTVIGDGDIVPGHGDELLIDGANFDYAATGDIRFKIFQLTNGAVLDLDAGGSITGRKIRAWIDRFGDTHALLSAKGDIRVNELELDDCVTDLKADGDVIIPEGFTLLDNDRKDRETVALTAGGNIVIEPDAQLTNAGLEMTAGGDVVFGGEIISEDSDTRASAEGSLTMNDADLRGGSFAARVDGDILFGILEARENALTLEAGGDILTRTAEGYIRYRDSDPAGDEKLVLGSGDDIGRADQRLIVDSDDILYITTVSSYYIDSLELTGDGLYQGRRPVQPQGSGRDEYGNIQSGDLLGDAGEDIVYGELEKQLNTDVAGMIVDRTDRAEASGLLDAEALAGLIRSGHITAAELSALLAGESAGTGLTPAELDKLLLLGDAVAEGGSESGYAELARLLLPKLTETITETAPDGSVHTLYAVSDEMLCSCLAAALDQDTVNIDRVAEMLTEIVTDEEIAQMIENAWKNADFGAFEDTRPADPDPRALEVQVGEATGAAYVWNAGDISITQQRGTLTVGAVHSDRGDVTLIADNGSIEGDGDSQTDIVAENISLTAASAVGGATPLTTEQRDKRITLVGNLLKPLSRDEVQIKALDANGLPTSEALKELSPKELWALETLIDFDWLRVAYAGEATRLDVTAGGDVHIREETGDMGLGEINAGGDVTLTAPGSMADKREAHQTAPNLTAGGNAQLSSGGAIGREDARIITDVDGLITAQAQEDISIRDTGDLDLVAQSDGGQVNAAARDELHLENLSGDLVVGPIEAGGTAQVTAQGSLIEGERYGREAQVVAESVDLTAKNGVIGSESDPFDVDTDDAAGGTLSARGEQLHLQENDGGLIIRTVHSDTDAKISAPGHILDGNPALADQAAASQQKADQAQADAEAARTEAAVKDGKVLMAEEALRQAEKERDEAHANTDASLQLALDEARNVLNGLDPDTQRDAYAAQQKTVKQLEKELAKALREKAERDEALYQAEAAVAAAEAELLAARQAAADAAEQARLKQQEADAALQQALQDKADAQQNGATVSTGGDLTLDAGGNIGQDGSGLSVRVGGEIDANSSGDIHLSGTGDMTLTDTTVPGTLSVTTLDGDINGGKFSAANIELTTLSGDIGSADGPLETDTDRLSAKGDNIYIHNSRDTEIGQIVGDHVELGSDGTVSGSRDGKTDIIGGDVTIVAEGAIGSKDQPLDTSVDALHGSGTEIWVDNHSGDLDITHVETDKLQVNTDGNITGNDIHTHDIAIHAGGHVGTVPVPFTFWADGDVDISAGLWVCHWLNLYRPASPFLYAEESFREIQVLALDVTVNGREMTLYVLVGTTDEGKLVLLGLFLGPRDTDEAFWLEILSYLRYGMGIEAPDTFVIPTLTGFRPAADRIYPHSSCRSGETAAELQEMLAVVEKAAKGETNARELLLSAGSELDAFTAEKSRWLPSADSAYPLCCLRQEGGGWAMDRIQK